MGSSPRVLSIQSHVVHGYCGNRSAVFPLQLLGFEVDYINSVQFSNHTGYKYWKGQVLNEEELEELMQGLELNNLDHYTHLLTGYVSSESFLVKMAEIFTKLKEKNPELTYVCDPVLGDDGKFYVPESLLPIYSKCILPLADIITPNQFELEMLSGIPVKSFSDLMCATQILHKKGPKIIVVSSSNISEDGFPSKSLVSYASSCPDGRRAQCFQLSMPYVPARFIGTGDLFASLLLAWMFKTNNDVKLSLENTVNSIQSVIKNTIGLLTDKQLTPENLELKLIQSKKDIENPVILLQSKAVRCSDDI